MYTKEIIWLIAWPVSIYLCYRVVLLALKILDKKETKETPSE
jgi:hypothetical protein